MQHYHDDDSDTRRLPALFDSRSGLGNGKHDMIRRVRTSVWARLDSVPDHQRWRRLTTFWRSAHFDPTMLPIEDIHWLDRCRSLAINSCALCTRPNRSVDHGGKAFISGRGRYDDNGTFDIHKPGQVEHNIGADTHTVNLVGGPLRAQCAFPFHEGCWRILERALESGSELQL
ncbi:hypothetical protein T440DRAFT_28761 [Plenodomus tracheiphilus IPT5]|uniref:Uncharacterized protein n=1 Tax=Plenodomus tracheiphilus IPT5 TaxID=1408161 RepID=A0A6A7BDK9_9PLEO|nr:hypothetical protein T440DRAFT_28761 [Plenodomus tracheiphilus IPT5]